MNTSPSTGHLGQLLCEAPFRQMFYEFSYWRMDTFIRQMEKERRKGRILAFVRGLRLSANLIYAIRQILDGTQLTANWGHLLDESRTFCSRECDVIIHRKGYIERWDGTENPVMDFRFIEQQLAVAVISCKSYLRSGDIDTEYCKSMEPFVQKIWLFAECCGPRSGETIRAKAFKHGYEQFWYLYTWSKQTEPKPDKEGWNKFVEEVKKLAQ